MSAPVEGPGRRRCWSPGGVDVRGAQGARRAAAPDPSAGGGERGSQARLGVLRAGERAPKISARHVRELAGDGVPVAVTCRVLGISRSGFSEADQRLGSGGLRRRADRDDHAGAVHLAFPDGLGDLGESQLVHASRANCRSTRSGEIYSGRARPLRLSAEGLQSGTAKSISTVPCQTWMPWPLTSSACTRRLRRRPGKRCG